MAPSREKYEVSAYNTSTASTNKIHDDTVARQFGFRGGLVAGVDVYAYLTRLPVARWGRQWLETGTLRARFEQPVYDGENVVVEMTDSGSETGDLELTGADGSRRATGEATSGATPSPAVAVAAGGALPQPIPDVTTELLAAGTVLAPLRVGFHAEHAPAYLADVRDDLPIYADLRCAHPGWLLRQANYVLTANVRLGPWIHVESWVRNHALVPDGARLEVRAVVRDEWEKKGHRFVTLDVTYLANDTVAASVEHTAIWQTRPRRPAAEPAGD